MSIQAMKRALEALETVRHQNMSPQIHPAKVALRTAIEEAEKQEPVAWAYKVGSKVHLETQRLDHYYYRNTDYYHNTEYVRGIPLYTHPTPVPPGWQPIETAPRDGTDVLIYTMAGSMYVAGYDDAFSNVWRIRNDEGVNSRVVTHWMPLPAAPKQEEMK